MKTKLIYLIPCLLASPAFADITLTIPKSSASQATSGLPPFSDEFTGNVNVQLSAKAVSDGDPGLFIVLGYAITCDGSSRTYGRELGTTKSLSASYTINVDGIKWIAEWDSWTAFSTSCQLKYRAEALGTSRASSWSMTGALNYVGINWTNSTNQVAPHEVNGNDLTFNMVREPGQCIF